jgi:hypothetical protein
VRKVPQELYAKGRQLAKAFGEGALRADYSSQQFETSGAGSDERAM